MSANSVRVVYRSSLPFLKKWYLALLLLPPLVSVTFLRPPPPHPLLSHSLTLSLLVTSDDSVLQSVSQVLYSCGLTDFSPPSSLFVLMASLEQECYHYICGDPRVQLSLVHGFAISVNAHQTPATAAGDGVAARGSFASIPSCSPGHPPEPHSETEGNSAVQGTSLGRAGGGPPPTFALPVTLDAFTVMSISPPLGEALLMTPADFFEKLFARAAVRWLVASAEEALCMSHQPPGTPRPASQQGTAPPQSTECSLGGAALRRCPDAYVHALAAGRVAVSVSLLVLRLPHFFSHVWGSPGDEPAAPQRAAAPVHPSQHTEALFSESIHSSAVEGLSPIAPDAAQPRNTPPQVSKRERAARKPEGSEGRRASASARRATALPADAFVEAFKGGSVCVVGTVCEVYFAARTAESPLPWISLLVLPSLAEGGRPRHTTMSTTQPASRVRRLMVDLRDVPAPAKQRALVIGQLLEVRGSTLVARSTLARDGMPRAASSAARSSPATEYLRASSVLFPLSRAECDRVALEATFDREAETEAKADPHTTSSSLSPLPPMDSPLSMRFGGSSGGSGWDGDAVHRRHRCPPSTPTPVSLASEHEKALSAEEENHFAVLSLRCWESFRVALGVDEAPFPRPSLHHSGEACADHSATAGWEDTPLVFCTDFFSVSFDAVVAVLVTLISAQAPGDEEGGVSLLLLDADVSPFFDSVRRTVERIAPCAFVGFSPVIISRARRSFFLPSYQETATAGHPTSPHQHQHTSAPSGGRDAVPGTVPPAHAEVIRGGALNHAHRRTLLLQGAEAMLPDTITLLQHYLASRASPDAGASDDDEGSLAGPEGHLTGHSAPPCAESAVCTQRGGGEGAAMVVRRVGGQRVPYLATRSVLLTVRDGGQLLGKPALFELAQRMDVVVRPAFDSQRKMLAVCGCTDSPAVQALVQERQEVWLGILGDVLALPHGDFAREQTPTLYTAPHVTTVCGNLLRTYFLTAKAVCGEAVDARMMETLVQLTCHHAQLRLRCTYHYYRHLSQRTAGRNDGVGTEVPVARQSVAKPLTALVDAVVAIGLCDATLHFITGKTILGECVLGMIAREGAPATESDAGGELLDTTTTMTTRGDGSGLAAATTATAPNISLPSHFSYGAEDEAREEERFARLVEVATRVERLDSDAAGFSIVDLVADLEAHLATSIHVAASVLPH